MASRALNILVIGGAIPWYPPVGGTALVPLHLGEALGKAGHHVSYLVVTLDGSSMESRYVHPLHLSLRRDSFAYRNRLVLPLFQYRRVARTLKQHDVVYCESHYAAFYAAHKAVYGGRPRLVAAEYEPGIPTHFWQRRSFFEPYRFLALRLADLVVCPSEDSRVNVSEAYGVPMGKTRAFYGGVEDHFLTPAPRGESEGGFTLVFCGRLNSAKPHKTLHVLLKAMPLVLSSHAAELIIVGTGPRLDEYVTLARTLGIEHAVRFLGHVEHSRLPSYYSNADLFVLPSLREGFPLVLVEAMACGLPVVATRVGGIPEVVEEGLTGLLVPPNDSRALAEAVNSLLDDPQRMRSMGAKGRQRVMEHFTWDKVAERMVGYFREIL